MRLLAFSLVISAACAGVTPVGSAAPRSARPIVLLVHGRGQFGQDTAQLHREWEADLDTSLAAVGMPALPPGDVRLAWYADALDPDSSYDCGARVATTHAGMMELRDVASGFLNFLSGLIGEESRELRGLVGETMYVLDSRTRCAAEERVGKAIRSAGREGRPVIVIAYSLGSLVTYGYLLRDTTLANVRLITVGAPLALRPVREIIFGQTTDAPLRVPKSVRSWDNVYDAADVFAGPLSGQLPPQTVRDRATHAPSVDEAHVISRYLRDPATGSALKTVICATSPARDGCAPH